jgi:hypothetical protein
MSKDKFLRVYSNLPGDIKKEIIVVIDGKPFNWDSALIEVMNDTTLGAKILEKLVQMELI